MSQYNFSLTTFSPSGKLGQIEHALTAVSQGVTTVGIKATNGVVIATEKKTASILVDSDTLEKVSSVCQSIGMVYSGMGPDARVLVNRARKSAQTYHRIYQEDPPNLMLVKDLANVMQEFTQKGGVRPFGVSLLVAGHDTTGPSLYQVDPSGSYFPWKATAIGKNMIAAKAFLEKRFDAGMELEDAVHTAILTLKEGFEGLMDEHNIEIGIIGATTVSQTALNKPSVPTFRKLASSEIRDYLANIN